MITLDSIELPDDLQWLNRHQYLQIKQNTFRALSGKLLITESIIPGGIKIVLQGSRTRAWTIKTVIDALNALASQVNQTWVLNYHGQQHNVVFDRSKAPVEPFMIKDVTLPGAQHVFYFKLNLIEI